MSRMINYFIVFNKKNINKNQSSFLSESFFSFSYSSKYDSTPIAFNNPESILENQNNYKQQSKKYTKYEIEITLTFAGSG